MEHAVRRQLMRPTLERVRGYSLLATVLLLPLLVVVVVLGAASAARQWDALYVAVSIALLIASTTFTVAAIALAMRRTRLEAAARSHTRPRSQSALSIFGLVALVANLTVIALSGRVNALNAVLALLIGSLLLLLREHSRREGIRERARRA